MDGEKSLRKMHLLLAADELASQSGAALVAGSTTMQGAWKMGPPNVPREREMDLVKNQVSLHYKALFLTTGCSTSLQALSLSPTSLFIHSWLPC